MEGIARHWPVAGVVVRTPRLELRWATEDDLAALADVAGEGIHDPDVMPFGTPWSRAPAGELERNLLQHHWRARAEWSPELWRWAPVVVVDGQVVGTQGIGGEKFAVRRTVSSGSWIGQRFQGQGIGTEMRAAALHLCFEGLGALRAETSAWEDNRASLGVTRKLGYSPNGDAVRDIEGKRGRELCFALSRETWTANRRTDIEIIGLDPCLVLFGAAEDTPTTASLGRQAS